MGEEKQDCSYLTSDYRVGDKFNFDVIVSSMIILGNTKTQKQEKRFVNYEIIDGKGPTDAYLLSDNSNYENNLAISLLYTSMKTREVVGIAGVVDKEKNLKITHTYKDRHMFYLGEKESL